MILDDFQTEELFLQLSKYSKIFDNFSKDRRFKLQGCSLKQTDCKKRFYWEELIEYKLWREKRKKITTLKK